MIRNIIEAVILVISVTVLVVLYLRSARKVDDLDGAELIPADQAEKLEDSGTLIASDYKEK